jgi:hypothetical protein
MISPLLERGALVMLAGAALFLLYAIAFFVRAFAGGGFEIGVPTLNGVTPADLDKLNPAIMAYITHVHVALAGFIAATALAVMALVWYGVRAGARWAWVAALIAPSVGLAVALPLHYAGGFQVDWVAHLGPVYAGAAVYVIGALMALAGQKPASTKA